MKKLLIFGGIFSMILVILGGYFFIQNNRGDDLLTQKNKLKSDLAIVENKLSKEKDKLKIMTSDLQNSFSISINVQDQIKKSLKIVSQTNLMFIDPNGSNPQLIIKNIPSTLLINKERKDVNLLLAEWQNKTDILYLKKIDIKEIEQIKKDAQTIQTYLKNLSYLVEILTPENSGISQFQINFYLSSLPSKQVINEVLVALQIAIDNSQTLNTQTGNNQNLSDSSLIIPTVTPDDVVAQQEVVDYVQAQVIALQEQLREVEKQIQQLSPTATPTSTTVLNSDTSSFSSLDVPSSSVDTSTTNFNSNITSNPIENNTANINSDSENKNTYTNIETSTDTNTGIPNNNNNSTDLYNNGVNNNSNNKNYQGIIIQPGPPQLIQGTNQY